LLLLAIPVALTGCSLFRPKMSRTREYQFGKVELLDYATCQKLQVAGQEAGRDRQGRLEVNITWENTTSKPYHAKIRRVFIDRQGYRERGAYDWNVHAFPPGKSELTWKSYEVGAVHYRIDVRKAD
jgi:hypothetical protein